MAGIGQDQLRLVGPDLIYGRLFDKIGFDAVRTSDNDIFKSLVVTRLYRPGSKLEISLESDPDSGPLNVTHSA